MSQVPVSHQQWRQQARCGRVDPNMFFDEELEDRAKAICRQCPVIEDCLEAALSDPLGNLLDGIWGGTTRGERRRLRKAAPRGPERASA